MFKILKKLTKNKDGATAVEYGLLLALISLTALAALNSIGVSLTTIYEGITESVDEPVEKVNANN